MATGVKMKLELTNADMSRALKSVFMQIREQGRGILLVSEAITNTGRLETLVLVYT